MLKLATLINNPGEPEIASRYNDPQALADLGYNALVVYQTTALSGVESTDAIESAELRRWVQHQIDHTERVIAQARAAGLEVYLFYDALVLPQQTVHAQVTAMTCKNRPQTLCPASEAAWEPSLGALEAMLRRWPDVAGVVLRFGETDAPRLPHLVGNDIYSPHCARCSSLGRADRVVATLHRFYDRVVGRMNKRLIARAWNVRPGGLHDTPELAERIIDRLPGDPADDRFVLSFKFTQTDFWRYQKWNPCSLMLGGRPVIYELQCQREFEGKGGFPNWQAGLWRDGAPEMADRDPAGGLAQVRDQVNLAGLWAWVRGGGWGGPFIKNETWIDANVYAVPKLADNPTADIDQLADGWLDERLDLAAGPLREALKHILIHSAETVRGALYIGPYALGRDNPWHPNADWIQDDLVDAEAVWRIIQRLPAEALDRAVQEKADAAHYLSEQQRALHQQVMAGGAGGTGGHTRLEPLVHTLVYAESLFETLRDMVTGLVAYRRFKASGDRAQADTARRALFHAQAHWNHHVQRVGTMPGVATPFRETRFWDLTQKILDEVAGG